MAVNYECINRACENYANRNQCFSCENDGFRMAKFYTCDCCGDRFNPKKLYDVDGDMMCEDCIKENVSMLFDKIKIGEE